MPFRRYPVDPSNKQGKVKATLSVSPKLSLSDPEAELLVTIAIGLDSSPSPSHKGQAITICTEKSIFDVFSEGEGGLDMFARGAFGYLRNVSDQNDRHISLGFFRVNEREMSDSKDLRERGYRFVTIPDDGSLVMITHRLNWERIFKYENKRTKEDLDPGERFAIRINKDYFGTRWWCWGDQESDLKDKKLHAWRPPYDIEDKPDDEFLRKGNWVLGEEPMTLDWEIVNEDSAAMFEVVE